MNSSLFSQSSESVWVSLSLSDPTCNFWLSIPTKLIIHLLDLMWHSKFQTHTNWQTLLYYFFLQLSQGLSKVTLPKRGICSKIPPLQVSPIIKFKTNCVTNLLPKNSFLLAKVSKVYLSFVAKSQLGTNCLLPKLVLVNADRLVVFLVEFESTQLLFIFSVQEFFK